MYKFCGQSNPTVSLGTVTQHLLVQDLKRVQRKCHREQTDWCMPKRAWAAAEKTVPAPQLCTEHRRQVKEDCRTEKNWRADHTKRQPAPMHSGMQGVREQKLRRHSCLHISKQAMRCLTGAHNSPC